MSMSENINELISALSKAQAEIQPAKKDSKNPYFNSDYASLSSVWEACRGPLSKNNLAVVQTTKETKKGTVLITTLAHSSGQWIQGKMLLRTAKILKNKTVDETGQYTSQGIGSALSYARRYLLAAMVGVSQEDDDGEGTTGRTPKPNITKSSNGNSPRPALKPKELLGIINRAIELNPLKDKTTGEALPISLLAIHNAPAVISSKFQKALGGDEEKYRNCLEWLFNVRTANDLTAAQGSALLDWLLGKGTDKKFDTPIKEPASVEAEKIAVEIKESQIETKQDDFHDM